MSDEDSDKDTKRTRKITSLAEEEKKTAKEITYIREALRESQQTKYVRKFSNINKDIKMVNRVEEQKPTEESSVKKINRQNLDE